MSGEGREGLLRPHITDQLLVDWFTKSLLPPISRDVDMGAFITEE